MQAHIQSNAYYPLKAEIFSQANKKAKACFAASMQAKFTKHAQFGCRTRKRRFHISAQRTRSGKLLLQISTVFCYKQFIKTRNLRSDKEKVLLRTIQRTFTYVIANKSVFDAVSTQIARFYFTKKIIYAIILWHLNMLILSRKGQ